MATDHPQSAAAPGELRRELEQAAAEGWSGLLEIRDPSGGRLGSTMLVGGQVAWATSVEQTEDLGSFLYRLGHVSGEQLSAVRAEFERLGGKKRLGRVLEEAGLIPRPVLRRCLLLHIRRALDSLLPLAPLEVVRHPGLLQAENEMTFPLAELLVDGGPPPGAGPAAAALSRSSGRALLALSSIPGYQGSILAAADGEVLAVHGLEETPSQASVLASSAVTLAESAAHSTGWTGLGPAELALVEANDGAILTRWIDPDRRLLVAIRLDSSGRLGVAKHKLDDWAASMRPFGAEYDKGVS